MKCMNFNKDKKYKKVSNRNCRGEECNTCIEKFNIRVQQQVRSREELISKLEERAVKFTQSEEQKEKMHMIQ